MEEHTPPQPRYGFPRDAIGRRRRWAPGRVRRLFLTVCAAVLAVALAATIYTTAEAKSAAPRAVKPAATGTPAPAPVGTPAPVGIPAPVGSPAPAATAAGVAPSATTGGSINEALDAELSGIIEANSHYQIGVALIDLSDGAAHEYGVQESFVAASTAKVLAAAAYYHLVETGSASLDDSLGDYTSGFQLKEMIQDSDNDSWSLIMDAVGHSELQDYASSIGVSYDPETNTLTPAEMAKVLAGLYAGTLLDPDDTRQLLSYMQDTNYETLIPAAVPAGVTVFHKYGLLGGELHDAGILAKDGRAYAFVVYTKGAGLSDVAQRTEVIHQLTQAVAGALF